MAAPEYTVKVYDVTHNSNSIAKAARLTVIETGTLTKGRGDAATYATAAKVTEITLRATIEAAKINAYSTVSVGDSGSLVASVEAVGTGTAQTITIANAVCVGVPDLSVGQNEAGTIRYEFEAYSSDGSTSPMSIADAS